MTDCNGFNLENIGNTLKALSDVASQTDEVSVPLPYPANLLYAQNMLAISMSALQSLELNIAQIHLYLREHELRTAAVSAASAKLAISAAGFKVTIINPASVGAGSGAQAAGVAAGVQEPREVVVVRGRPWEPPAGGQDAPPAEAMHRRRLAVAVKIAVVMFFFDFRIGWWVLYFFGIFLYIGGLFDPFIEWIQSHSLQATLEQQLLNLQQRQRRADDLPGAQPDAGASEDPGTGAQPGSSQGSSEGAARAETGTAARPEGRMDDGTGERAGGTERHSDESGQGDVARDAAVEAELRRVPWVQQFFYQLVVMFFMTLLPWWNPDPRYL